METINKRLCIICGARVRNLNKKVNTCSPVCTRAKHNKRTLEEQNKFEIDNIPYKFHEWD